MSMKFSNIAVLNIKGCSYCCIISGISKSKATNEMQNTDLIKKWNTIKHKNLLFSLIYLNYEILTFWDIKIENK